MPNTTNTSSTDTRTSRPRGGGRTRTVRGRASYRTGSFEVFAYPHHSPLALAFGALWRWGLELLPDHHLASGVGQPGLPTPDLAHLGCSRGAGHRPHRHRCGPRRLGGTFVRRAWCVYSRHRVRKCSSNPG